MRKLGYWILAAAAVTLVQQAAVAKPTVCNAEDWPFNCAAYTDSGNSSSSSGPSSPADTVNEEFVAQLAALNNSSVLPLDMAQLASVDLATLVGFYGTVLTEDGVTTLKTYGIATSGKFKLAKSELKSRKYFGDIVQSKFDAGVKLPILKFGFKRNQIGKLDVDAVAHASIGNPDVDTISCSVPRGLKNFLKTGQRQVVFVNGAEIVRVTKEIFSEGDLSAEGVFSVIGINGKTYVSGKKVNTVYMALPRFVEVLYVSDEDCEKLKAETASKPKSAGPLGVRAVEPAKLGLVDLVADQNRALGANAGGGRVLKLEKGE